MYAYKPSFLVEAAPTTPSIDHQTLSQTATHLCLEGIGFKKLVLKN